MIEYIDAPDPYRPGACNIGPAEIARRRRSAIAMTAATVLVAVALVVIGAPPVTRLLAFPFAAASGVTWLQVVRRFCVGFGAVGIRNFGALGSTLSVSDARARSADRRMALRLVVEGSAYGLAATVLFALLPV